MKKLGLTLLAAAALAGFTPRAARADTIGFTTAGASTVTPFGSTLFGYTFTLTNSVSVTQLGFWDYQANGLAAAVPVTIWNSSGTAQATATVPNGTSSGEINQYLYVTLATPVTLAAGTYTIGGYVTTSNEAVQYSLTTVTGATGITYGAARSGNSNAYPAGDTVGRGANSYFGPNFQFTAVAAVPEPSTWALLGVGVAGLGVVTLRRRRYELFNSPKCPSDVG